MHLFMSSSNPPPVSSITKVVRPMCSSAQQRVASASPDMFGASCTPATLAQQAICADMRRFAGGRKLSRPPIQQGTSRLHTRLCQRKED